MAIDHLRSRPDLRISVMAELAPGESLLYVAQPDWRAERGKLIVFFLFAVFWSAISLLFFGMSLASLLGLAPIPSGGQPGTGMMVFFLVFSLPFVAIGFGMLAGPFLGIRKANNTAHAITDARLINVFGGADRGVESYKLETINFITRDDRRNGTGSLSIGYGVGRDSDGDPRPLTTDWSGIPDAKRAEALIRQHAKWVR